jgi:hypothetical protein
MKAADLPPNDQLHRMIEATFGKALGVAAGPPVIVPDWKPMGPPTKPELIEAYEAVEMLVLTGSSLTRARQRVFEEHRIRSGFEAFERSHQKHASLVREQKFYSYVFNAAILEGDVERAIEALKLCSDDERSAICAKMENT